MSRGCTAAFVLERGGAGVDGLRLASDIWTVHTFNSLWVMSTGREAATMGAQVWYH